MSNIKKLTAQATKPQGFQPYQIKGLLYCAGYSPADLAKVFYLNRTLIHDVISGRRKSENTERIIAKVLKTQPCIIWPDRYTTKNKRHSHFTKKHKQQKGKKS